MINIPLKPRLRQIGVILFAVPAVGAACRAVQAQRSDARCAADRRDGVPRHTGIQDKLADKASKLGIPVWRVRRQPRVSAALPVS